MTKIKNTIYTYGYFNLCTGDAFSLSKVVLNEREWEDYHATFISNAKMVLDPYYRLYFVYHVG